MCATRYVCVCMRVYMAVHACVCIRMRACAECIPSVRVGVDAWAVACAAEAGVYPLCVTMCTYVCVYVCMYVCTYVYVYMIECIYRLPFLSARVGV